MVDFLIQFSIAMIIVTVIWQKNQKKARGGDGNGSGRRAPSVGTPDARHYPSQDTPQARTPESLEDMIKRYVESTAAPTNHTETINPAPAPQPPRPVLQRNPYAERSDYGSSPLSGQKPPSQSPMNTMLDQAFLGPQADQQEEDLPLEPAPLPSAPDLNQAIVTKTLANAFPAAVKMARDSRPGIHRPIHLNARGRKNVRQAVLMSEVLTRPRAFDL